jgi:predicted AAA+ superfamily ATPase
MGSEGKKTTGGGTRGRVYDAMLDWHLRRDRQMAFVAGPRQVGKTTTCRRHADEVLNWDNADDRAVILAGPAATAQRLALERLRSRPPVTLIDEIHKFGRWKAFLKGFFDTYGERSRLIVTGSSRLDIYRRGGDSLMGRYLLYRMHPFTVGEIVDQRLPDEERIVRAPRRIADGEWMALWEHGGFPEPFTKRDRRFTRRWAALRRQQLVREDIRDLTHIHELSQIEALVRYLESHSGDQVIYSTLAGVVGVSVDTARRWVATLAGFYLGFTLQPWFTNVARSLRKEPKWFLRDWSLVADAGKRAETFVACHLLKAVEGWTDLGLGEFRLAYLRDKGKREVDFIVIRDGRPWFLVEVKQSDTQLQAALGHFQRQLGAPQAFQVVIDADYVAADCFARAGEPLVVPARTFLSQLL